MEKEKIKQVINNSYKSTSEGFLIDVDWASTKLEAFIKDENKHLTDQIKSLKDKLNKARVAAERHHDKVMELRDENKNLKSLLNK